MESVSKKIVLLHWIGRFGNRMFQYAFGCSYAKKYDCIFYMPSEWEGTLIFKKNKYTKIVTDDELRLHINQKFVDKKYRSMHLDNYKKRTGDSIELVKFNNKQNVGKTNIAFQDLYCMHFSFLFEIMDSNFLKEIFTFNDNVKNSEMYKWFESRKHTYDLCHLRRGDISYINYQGSHSMISKESYLNQLNILKINKDDIVWISDDPCEKTPNIWNVKSAGHIWDYPCGEQYCPEIFLDFLPDLLNIIFARKILRGNSSFSWWGVFLSNAVEIYSPLIKPKPIELKNKYFKQDTEFVKGNHPHFMGNKCEHLFNDIIFV
uniref:Glycosyltransferase n=1 Tax=viral metagenome TaxID=1070528 RepID=A0A6C0D9J4_9ZZZZ